MQQGTAHIKLETRLRSLWGLKVDGWEVVGRSDAQLLQVCQLLAITVVLKEGLEYTGTRGVGSRLRAL